MRRKLNFESKEIKRKKFIESNVWSESDIEF